MSKVDRLTKEQRHKNMKNIRSKDTSIELKLRKELWRRGYRYRKNYTELPGKPDIVLTKYKIAIFCDSEFFHGKDWEVLKPQLEKGKNADFWIEKISKNQQHDDDINKQLQFLGWTVIRFWGKDIMKKTDECIQVIEENIFELESDAVQCYTARFKDNERLASFRSPHNSPNNILHFHNVYSDKLSKYFANLGRNVIVINMIGTDVQARASGMDEDTDFVYTTNQPDLAELARKAYTNYPTIINLLVALSKLAQIDFIINSALTLIMLIYLVLYIWNFCFKVPKHLSTTKRFLAISLLNNFGFAVKGLPRLALCIRPSFMYRLFKYSRFFKLS